MPMTATERIAFIRDRVRHTGDEETWVKILNDLAPRTVAVGDENYTFLVANSGRVHRIANVSADRTFTLPAEEDGLEFILVATVVAADGHDWIIDSGSNTNYFTGGIVHVDQDAAGSGVEAIAILPDGNSNSKLQVNLPNGGTYVRLVCDGTTWVVSGTVVSATAPAFADQ